jgi:hypothetical protein
MRKFVVRTLIGAVTLGAVVTLSLAFLPSNACAQSPGVEIRDNQLVIDGQKQPQLFGAELQYFRLRGGYGRNIPRAKVIDLWNRALDKMVEAHMNAISFYIPWDFHEYADGKFDFTGTVDEDGDGNPDYPSRDVITFFRLVKEHGIKNIMVRPGPYINAEWGFLGFGAIPEWFHTQFPDSHMRSPFGLRTKLYDYHNPDLLKYTKRWFTTLYSQVLQDKIGPGLPIRFVQIDNETNFMWQSLYNHDYGAPAIARYQDFLKSRYGTLAALNTAHSRSWKAWKDVKAPVSPRANLMEDQDWYRFQDVSIYDYLHKIRQMWEDLGVHEPDVLFTLAESYNAMDFGLLPNYRYRNAPKVTGMMTTNLYPKTFELPFHPMHNDPFKADLDVLAADEASDLYIGRHEEWAMGPEIQAGWWRGVPVSSNSRQQTYLTVTGHGLKAFFVYYFNEGDNFGSEWQHDKVWPLYTQLCSERGLISSLPSLFPDSFWTELGQRTDQQVIAGIDVRHAIMNDLQADKSLYFDAPLDGNAQPRDHFFELKNLGEKIYAPYGSFLAASTNVFDDVTLVKDDDAHVPSPLDGVNSVSASSQWYAGLLGALLNEGVTPRIAIGDISPRETYASAKVLMHIDTGVNAPETVQRLKDAEASGQGILNFLSESALNGAKSSAQHIGLNGMSSVLEFYLDQNGQLQNKEAKGVKRFELTAQSSIANANLWSYKLPAVRDCTAILYFESQVVGYRCRQGQSYITQLGANLYDEYDSSEFVHIADFATRRLFTQALLKDFGVKPKLGVDSRADRVAAFARVNPARDLTWITVKTTSRNAQALRLTIDPSVLPIGSKFEVTDLLNGSSEVISSQDLTTNGFALNLKSEASTVFVVRAKP